MVQPDGKGRIYKRAAGSTMRVVRFLASGSGWLIVMRAIICTVFPLQRY